MTIVTASVYKSTEYKILSILFMQTHPFQSSLQGHEPSVTSAGDMPLCLDYIWYSPDNLRVSQVLNVPDNVDILHQRTPQSCVLFPSDHIPLQAQFTFLPNTVHFIPNS